MCIKVDGEILSSTHSKITQENIISTVQEMKQKLLDSNLDKEKIYNIYDISIEMLQNILKYSYGNKVNEDNTKEADGQFVIAYDSNNDEFNICSCNLITELQVEKIEQRIKELNGLDEKGLRKLLRSKMKSRRDNHKHGAGLGFATIATKISKPLKAEFEKIFENVVKYKLTVIV
jgi:hypothetical protein